MEQASEATPSTGPEQESAAEAAGKDAEALERGTSILADLGMDELEASDAIDDAEPSLIQSPQTEIPQTETPQTSPPAVSPAPTSEIRPSARALGATPTMVRERRIRRLRAVERNGSLEIEVVADGKLRDFRSFSVENPRRLVVDLPGSWSPSVPKDLSMGHYLAQGVRIGRHGDHLRLVVDLMPDAQSVPLVRSSADGLVIEVQPASLQPLPL